jgi:hypothetical protein
LKEPKPAGLVSFGLTSVFSLSVIFGLAARDHSNRFSSVLEVKSSRIPKEKKNLFSRSTKIKTFTLSNARSDNCYSSS